MPAKEAFIISLKLRDLSQLFNSMDPSPFHEKDLDQDAEEFIESWATEFGPREPVALVVQLDKPPPAEVDARAMVAGAVHNFYAYKAQLKRRELRRLLRRGQTSLIIGLTFLAGCLFAGELVSRQLQDPWDHIVQESLLIIGWVAMWRPLEIFLYEWWPIGADRRLYDRLSRMEVRVEVG